jgi:hypothetical protein
LLPEVGTPLALIWSGMGRHKQIQGGKMLSVKVSSPDHARIEAAATRRNVDLSVVIREVVRSGLEARLLHARCIEALRSAAAEEAVALAADAEDGALVVLSEAAARRGGARDALLADLWRSYEDAVLGRHRASEALELDDVGDFGAMRLRGELAAAAPERRLRAEAELRLDLGLPPVDVDRAAFGEFVEALRRVIER